MSYNVDNETTPPSSPSLADSTLDSRISDLAEDINYFDQLVNQLSATPHDFKKLQ